MKTKFFLLMLLVAFSQIIFQSGCKDEDIRITTLCPLVVSTDPANLATSVPLEKVVSATFNKKMDPETFTAESFTLYNGTKIEGAVTFSDSTVFFTPAEDLTPDKEYTGTVKATVRDLNGINLKEDYIWTFTTVAIPMYTLNVTAVNGTVDIDPDQTSYESGTIVMLTPIPDTGYIFTGWSGDATGTDDPLSVTMDSDKNITANFAEVAPIGPGKVDLKTAGDFVILTKSGISTTGATSITGDIGVSPAAASAITGFDLIMDTDGQSSSTPIVNGKVYASDYADPTPAKLTTAVSDMETAFTTANGLTEPAPIVDLYAGDISGRTLAPGLYKWSTGVLVTSEGVTLSGGPNDTWVFQISQDFTVNNSAAITLEGGAKAENIFWVVSGQATLGTDSDVKGNILSQTLISLNTGAKVTGRLLAQTAVTLNASTVVLP